MIYNNLSVAQGKHCVLTNEYIDQTMLEYLLQEGCSVITPIISRAVSKEITKSRVLLKNSYQDVLQSTRINNGYDKYENTKYLEELAKKLQITNTFHVSIITSKYCRILPMDFQERAAYILSIEKGTDDYDYEYVEYVLKKLTKSSFLIATPTAIKNSSDINAAMKINKKIVIAAMHKSLNQQELEKVTNLVITKFMTETR